MAAFKDSYVAIFRMAVRGASTKDTAAKYACTTNHVLQVVREVAQRLENEQLHYGSRMDLVYHAHEWLRALEVYQKEQKALEHEEFLKEQERERTKRDQAQAVREENKRRAEETRYGPKGWHDTRSGRRESRQGRELGDAIYGFLFPSDE